MPQATHYRIGYVNMETDYPLAKASTTGDWINAFIYVDEDARNLKIANGRAEYTVRRLAQGVRHAFTVLSATGIVNTRQDLIGAYSWPQNPRWQFLEVADQGGACPTVPPATTPPSGGDICPITGLPIPPGGYLSVGERTTLTLSDAFTLTRVIQKETIQISAGGQYFEPISGRQYITVCGTVEAGSTLPAFFDAGEQYQVSTDAGIGFAQLDNNATEWGLVPAGQSRNGCETWEVPEAAETVIVAVDNWRAGRENASASLYRVELPTN